jgi:hypothetical protein
MTKFSDGFPLSPGGPGHKLNATGTVAVATHVYWQRIDADTPRGVKLQLLSKYGVATYGELHWRDTFWTHWAPLPRRARDENE